MLTTGSRLARAVLVPALLLALSLPLTPARLQAAPPAGGAPQGVTESATVPLSPELLRAFEADVEAAMRTYRVPGMAVALVQGNGIVYGRGFGVRDVGTAAPVTPRSLFRVGSTTKAMTSALVATYVDEGLLGWDQRVLDVWPEFRAPTPELTQTLRVRDLLGAASGLAESPTAEDYLADESPLDVMRSLAYLPVIAAPGREFFYNNTLYAAGGYLAALRQRTPPEELGPAYARQMRERLFLPSGMRTAVVGGDPRPFSDDFAAPHTRSLLGGDVTVPFHTINGGDPSGATMASAEDMAHFLILQLGGGVAADGRRVVSAANLGETWRGHISMPHNLLYPADATAEQYAMGWATMTLAGGRRLLVHNGGITGFATQMGFFPAEGIGFVLLCNLDPEVGGLHALIAAQDRLVRRLFGAGATPPVDDQLQDAFQQQEQARAALGAQLRPLDAAAVAPYLAFLGDYGHGWRLSRPDATTLRLGHDQRWTRLGVLSDGALVGLDGPWLARRVTVSPGPDGVPLLEVEGYPAVPWLVGPAAP